MYMYIHLQIRDGTRVRHIHIYYLLSWYMSVLWSNRAFQLLQSSFQKEGECSTWREGWKADSSFCWRWRNSVLWDQKMKLWDVRQFCGWWSSQDSSKWLSNQSLVVKTNLVKYLVSVVIRGVSVDPLCKVWCGQGMRCSQSTWLYACWHQLSWHSSVLLHCHI